MTSHSEMSRSESFHFKACHCCGLVHQLPHMATYDVAVCSRCRTTLAHPNAASKASSRTAALALAAFILYWPAILLPILHIEKLGHHRQSSIVTGVFELLQRGDWFVGIVVLLFSIIFPMAKLVLLLELSLLELFQRRHKALSYRLMEHAGKWSMMDVMLLSFLVMMIKLGSLVKFHFGPAVLAFVLCVAMSMAASLLFDPHAIWEDDS